ncbi:hypothetical protein [Egicoccus sp. AB-alg6-2]|uniref:hypothetical protein n=1 Tax=Egicoccus sp. AB-alg6-2 TaxID=3242692 RepID=UPI00359F0710
MPSVDDRALDIARSQRGLATRRQLLDAGVSPATITRRLQNARWSEPVAGVVDVGTHEPTWHGRLQQVLLATGPASWVSHRCAAYLHRFLDVDEPGHLDILVRRGRHTAVGALRLHTTLGLADDETTAVSGLRCTTRARTLLDLAATTATDELERQVLELARRDRTAFRQLGGLLARYPTMPGRRRLLTVLARQPEAIEKLGSALEVIGLPALLRHGAPAPTLQYQVRDRGGAAVKRVDAAWPDLWTILEFDGAAYHDTSAARRHDAEVRDRMRALGWTVEVLRFADLDGPRPAQIAARLRERAATTA